MPWRSFLPPYHTIKLFWKWKMKIPTQKPWCIFLMVIIGCNDTSDKSPGGGGMSFPPLSLYYLEIMRYPPISHNLMICLFVWGFSSHSRIFHSYGDFTITGEGLQILTCARHSWPLSSEGYLACNTCHYSCHYLFLRTVAAGIRTLNLPLVRRML